MSLPAQSSVHNEQRLRALFLAKTSSIYRMSPDWRVMYQLDSDTLAETPEPLENWADKYILEEDREKVFATIAQSIESKSLFELEHRVLLANGEVGWTLSRAAPIFDDSGKIVEWFGTANDVSERVRADSDRFRLEQRVRSSEEQKEFLLRFSDALRPLRDGHEIQRLAARLTAEHFRVANANYASVETENGTEYYHAQNTYSAPGRPSFEGRYPLVEFPGVTEALRSGETMVVADVQVDPKLQAADRASYSNAGIGSFAIAPLVKDGRFIAMFAAHDPKTRAWTYDDISLLENIADRTWAAVEQSRAEAALRISESRERKQNAELLAMLGSISDAVYMGNFNGITLANQAALDQLGYVDQDEMNRQISTLAEEIDTRDLSTGRPIAFQDQAFVRALQGEEHVSEVLIRHRVTGEDRALRCAASPIKLDGQLIGAVAVNTDITGRERIQAALRDVEKRQSFLLKLSDALRPLSDPVAIQKVAARMLGEHLRVLRAGYGEVEDDVLVIRADYTQGAASLNGRYPLDAFGPTLAKAYREGGVLVVRDTEKDTALTEAEREQFSKVQVAAHITVATRKAGHHVISLGVQSDIPRDWTEDEVAIVSDIAERTWAAVIRARAETALKESEERFRLFVENVREYALVQTDLEGIVTNWNSGAERLFGYNISEVLGRPFAVLLPLENRHEGLVAREMAQLAQGKKSEASHFFERKDGSRFWCEWITEPIFDDGGRLCATAKVMRDQTERQHAETEIRHSLAEKEELLKEVHHRVKNNLQVITSLLNLQAEANAEPATLAAFAEAENRIQSISAIHELLYRSVSFSSISLRDYAMQLSPSLVRFYGMGDRVRVEVAGDEATIELERAVPFGLLLNELLSNALKHAFPERRTGYLRVNINRVGAETIVRVSDTGIGLPPAFDPERTTSLGLKLVNIFMRQIRGSIVILPGSGTTFEARFPTVDLHEEETTV